jgi:hypothetical protein
VQYCEVKVSVFHIILMSILLISCAATKDVITHPPSNYGIMEFEGTFQGKNVYVQNPFEGDSFCAFSVVINDSLKMDPADVQYSAFEIDLIGFGFNIGDPVKVRIYHGDDCLPKVLNPEVR